MIWYLILREADATPVHSAGGFGDENAAISAARSYADAQALDSVTHVIIVTDNLTFTLNARINPHPPGVV